MKILRSVNRRGFSLGTAGWFSVLKPNAWFPASRLPGTFRYRRSQSTDAPAVHAEKHKTTVPPRIMVLTTKDRDLTRLVLVVLAAIAITSALLLWIMHPNLQ